MIVSSHTLNGFGLRRSFIRKIRKLALRQPIFVRCNSVRKIDRPLLCDMTSLPGKNPSNLFSFIPSQHVFHQGFVQFSDVFPHVLHSNHLFGLWPLSNHYSPRQLEAFRLRLEAGQTFSYAVVLLLYRETFTLTLPQRIWAALCGLEPPKPKKRTWRTSLDSWFPPLRYFTLRGRHILYVQRFNHGCDVFYLCDSPLLETLTMRPLTSVEVIHQCEPGTF